MKINKLFVRVIIILIIGVAFFFIAKKMGWLKKGETIQVVTEKPQLRTIIETITASGKVQPEMEVKLSPDVSGEVVELYVKEGDRVKKGDVMLKIKPDIYLSNLDRVEASLNSAKAQLAQSEAQFIDKESSFKRSQSLWNKKAISEAEFETAQSAFKMAKANFDAARFSVNSAQASLKEANENLVKTTIYAPIDGTISKLNIEKGERVVGTIQMAGTELLRIANLNLMEVKVEVNENDIVRVSEGDTALIEVDAFLNRKFKGIVTEISNSANEVVGISTDQVTNFDVKIRILQESYADLIPANRTNYFPFRPGMSATVDIQTKIKKGILSIPIQAVTSRTDTIIVKEEKKDFKNEQLEAEQKNTQVLKELIFIYQDGICTSKEVTTGIQDNDYIEILTGITAADEIVVAPYSAISKSLKDGIKVVKVLKSELFNETDKK